MFTLSVLLGGVALSACGGDATPTTPPAALTQAPAGSSSDAAVETGRTVFARYCNSCHPGGGRGAGPSMASEAPRFSDEGMASLIRRGKGRMPGYNETQISEADLNALVAYVRTFK